MIAQSLKLFSRELDLFGSQILNSELLDLFNRIPITRDDLEPWTVFDPKGYTRTIIRRTFEHELICCGWLPGQFSPIHDHVRSRSFVNVIAGEATEYLFDDIQGFAKLNLVRTLTRGTVQGEVGSIHRFGNAPLNQDKLVTLHVYVPPIAVDLSNPNVYAGGKVYEELPATMPAK